MQKRSHSYSSYLTASLFFFLILCTPATGMTEDSASVREPGGDSAVHYEAPLASESGETKSDDKKIAREESNMLRSAAVMRSSSEPSGGGAEMPADAIQAVPVPAVYTATGALTQQLPIQVPAGRAGLTPSLALSYNSYNKNGILGMGWALDFGSIQRSTQKGIDYQGKKFKAGGGDLVPINTDDRGNGEYRAKIEGAFARYSFDASRGWIVTSKDGKKYYYGQSPASRHFNPENPSQVLKWCLDKIEDTNGNQIRFSYIQSNGAIYPHKVFYNFTDSDNAFSTVELIYNTNRADPQLKSASTWLQKTSYLLKAVVVKTDNSIVRSYFFKHATSPAGQSLLSDIYLLSSEVNLFNSGTTTLNDVSGVPEKSRIKLTSMDYSPDVFSFSSSDTGPSVFINDDRGAGTFEVKRLRTGDFNGDGRQDIARINGWETTEPISIFLSNGDGSFQPALDGPRVFVNDSLETGTLGLFRVKTGDFNGDGVTDFARVNGWDTVEPISIFIGKGDGSYNAPVNGPRVFVNDSISTATFEISRLKFGDFNGDGRTDIARVNGWGTVEPISIFLAKEDGTFNPAVNGPKVFVNDSVSTGMFEISRIKLGDFNGDGKTDLARVNGWETVEPISIFLAKGDGTFLPKVNGPRVFVNDSVETASFEISRLLFGDFNGDGKTDISRVNGWGTTEPISIFLAKGDGTFSSAVNGPSVFVNDSIKTASFELSRLKLGDFNGDGATDIIRINGWGSTEPMSVFLARGDGTFSAPVNGPGVTVPDGNCNKARFEVFRFIPADYTGDGKVDIARANGMDTTVPMTIHRWADTPVNTMTSTTNRLGATSTISYKRSSEYTNHKLPYAIQTVAAIKTNDGLGNTIEQTCTYSGGYQDYKEREFRGFENVTIANPETKTTSLFEVYDPYLKGRTRQTRTWDNSGTLLSRSELLWEKKSLPSGSAAFVRLTSRTATEYDGETSATTTEEYLYHQENGEAVRVTTSGPGADGQEITVVTEKEYENVGEWVWRVTKETVRPLGGNVLRSTEYGYQPETGNMLCQESWLDGGANPKTVMAYDEYGNMTGITDPRGNVTTTVYDDLTHTFPVKVSTPETTNPVTQVRTAHVTEYLNYDYRFDTPRKTKDENGNITEYFLDEFGRTVRVDTPDGGQAVTIYRDNVFPKQIINMINESDTGADAWDDGYGGKEGYEGCIGRGIETYQYIDGLGRTIQTVSFGENRKPVITKMSYDRMGRNHLVEGPFFGSGAGWPQATPAETPYAQTIFDKRGRPVETRSPIHSQTLDFHAAPAVEETITTFSYNGFETTVTDPDGGMRTETKDFLGRLIEVIEYADNNEKYHTKYFYNVAGDLLTVRDHLGNETTIQYDTLGRKTAMNDPDMGAWGYTYDPNGNMISQTDAKGQRIELAYDEQSRVTRKSYSTGEPDVVYTYDEGSVGNATVANGIGSIYSVSNVDAEGKGVKTTCDAFDSMGRVTKQTRTLDGTPYTTNYTFDIAGRPETLIYPDQYVLKYDYHPGSGLLRLVFAITDFHTYARYTNYDATGKTGQAEIGNGTSTRYTYDPWSKRLIGYINADSSLEPDRYLQHKIYAYSKAGDITSITDHKKSVTQNYTYDSLHRLVSEKSTGGAAVSGVTCFKNTFNGDQLHAAATVTVDASVFQFTYDENGNLTKGPDFSNPASVATREIEYNADNMPVTIKRNGATAATFAYDGAGTRYKKSSGSLETLYVSDNYEIRNGTATKYIFGGTARIARVSNNKVLYYHKDHLGSSVMLTDENEQPVGGASEYTPFGMDRNPSAEENKNYKFTDQEQDRETGLYNYDARLYDPVASTFVTADTVVPDFCDPQSLNRYSYCRNNPIIYTDPSGHVFLVDDILIGAALGAAIGGITSEATGGSFKDGIVSGAIGGAFFGAAGGIITEAGISSTAAQVGLHSGVGAVSGGINAGIADGDIGMGMLTGGLSGGVGKFADPFMGNTFGSQLLGRSAIGGLAGGISSELYGGTFAQGFSNGALTAGIGFCCNDFYHNKIIPKWNEFKSNYAAALKELYGKDLEIANTLGIISRRAFIIDRGIATFASIAEFAGAEQISASRIAGASCKGDILKKMAAANKGAKIARGTLRLTKVLRGVGIATGVPTAAATGYQLGAIFNASGHAIYRTFIK